MFQNCLWLRNFFDPRWSSDGKPYGPERYKQIVHERYLLTKKLNTSYTDTASITPTERNLLLQFLKDDLQRESDAIARMQNQKHNR